MKKYEPIASVTTKRSRGQKTRARPRLLLILALAVLSLSALTIHIAAQKRGEPAQRPGPKATKKVETAYVADLIPLPRGGVAGNRDPVNFCYGEPNSGTLTVRVHNQGNADVRDQFAVAVGFDVRAETRAVGDSGASSNVEDVEGVIIERQQFARLKPGYTFRRESGSSVSVWKIIRNASLQTGTLTCTRPRKGACEVGIGGDRAKCSSQCYFVGVRGGIRAS